MLKLERHAKENKIAINIRKRSRILSREMAAALLIGLGIHFLFAFLFHIELGSISLSPPDQPLFQVSSSIGMHGVTVDKQVAAETRPVPHYLALKHPTFPEPVYSEVPSISQIPYPTAKSIPRLDFDSTHIDLEPSGPCVGKIILPPELRLKKGAEIVLESKKPCAAALFVRVDTKSGHVFWIDWEKRTGEAALDQKIERVMKELLLSVASGSLIGAGKIGVEFNP